MKKNMIILSTILITLDFISKQIITNTMKLLESKKIIKNFFHITYTRNEGAAFSILNGGRIFFIILSIIVLFILIKHIVEDNHIRKIEFVSYSLLLSGIIGNLIDRVFYGYVIDFLDFYIFGYNFPVFNIADICIVIGSILFIGTFMTKGEKNEIIKSR